MRQKPSQTGALASQRRVLVLSNYPAPYRQPLFEAVGQALRACNIDLHVYYAAATESVRDWSVDLTPGSHQVHVGESRTWGTGVHGFSRFSYDGIGRLAKQLQPDLCLVDGFSPGAMKLALQVPRCRLGMWSGAIGDEPGPLQFLRRLQRRWLVGRSSCAIVLSSAARDYLVALGMPPGRISTALNCAAPVRAEHFYSPPVQPMARPMRFLIVGALHPRKGIDLVLNALVRLRDSGQSLDQTVEVWIVGSGPARDELRSQISQMGLGGCCQLLGHLIGVDLQDRYAAADMLLFPTRHDIWGLVVNEAMQFWNCQCCLRYRLVPHVT